MQVRRSAQLPLWRFDQGLFVAGFRRTFKGLTDKLLLIALLSLGVLGSAYAIHCAAATQFPRRAAWFVLLSWPLTYIITKSLRGRLYWFEECTPLCPEALNAGARRAYLFLPTAAVGALFVIIVLIVAPDIDSKIGLSALAVVGLVGGVLNALAWAPQFAFALPSFLRSHSPPGRGRQMFTRCVIRSQLYGLPPRTVVLAGLGAVIFSCVTANILLVDKQHAALFAAGITGAALAAFSRPDFHLSKCAPKIGIGPLTVISAHGLLPLGIVSVATGAVLVSIGFSKPFLAIAWSTWALFYAMSVLRALRYPRYSRHSAELRLIGDIVILAVLATAFLPFLIPGVLLIIGQAAIVHRRQLWMLK